jgi:RNA polymerase sigma-70 factor, ECF subfamily
LARPGVFVNTENDEVLVQRWRDGDREALAEIVVRYQRPIYNAAIWIVRKAEDASDVTQNVFVKVAEQIDDYDSQYRFFSWIYRIAVNESLNLLRRNRREEALDDDADFEASEGTNPETQAGLAESVKRIRRALMGMTTADRMVLTLRHFSECSYQEIAQILEIDEKTVKSRLFTARQRLRDLLKHVPGLA